MKAQHQFAILPAEAEKQDMLLHMLSHLDMGSEDIQRMADQEARELLTTLEMLEETQTGPCGATPRRSTTRSSSTRRPP